VRFSQFIAVTSMALMWALAPAQAERRVALVIGNDRYTNLPANEQLQRAVNDAQAVGDVLKRIGFDVITGENLGRQALLTLLDEAAQRLMSGDMVFFFFSGHGVAVDGFNYILPTDVPTVRSGQIVSLTGAAIKEEDITAAFLRAGARVAVVVLDACRDNPFSISGAKGMGSEKGLAPHEPPSGVFTFYAASRGEAALDRLYDDDRNPNSVFTRVLLPALTRRDLDLPALAREVREEVTQLARTVNHAQRPAYYDETSGDRIFLAGPGVAPPMKLDVSTADPCGGPVTASFPSRCTAPLTAVQERGLKPRDAFRECENCPEMVVVPAGSFMMGSAEKEEGRWNDEGPQHVVTLGKAFGAGKWHVTVDQFAAFVQETGYASTKCYKWPSLIRDGSWRDPGFAQDGSHPVVCVSWDDATAFVNWMAKRTGKPYRLLSEAEWEYAARGQMSPGAYPRFWFGNDEKEFCQNGNGADQKARDTIASAKNWRVAPCNDGYAYTSPAGHYAPNPFGLHDMAGNAWQWTADCYYDSYNGAPADGSAWTTGACDNGRVVRGGSWDDNPRSLRVAHRGGTTGGTDFVGFRLARTLTR
jgi:formylglycine-generating enzyme required for sulfatase activity